MQTLRSRKALYTCFTCTHWWGFQRFYRLFLFAAVSSGTQLGLYFPGFWFWWRYADILHVHSICCLTLCMHTVSTALDMAVLSNHAMQSEAFQQVRACITQPLHSSHHLPSQDCESDFNCCMYFEKSVCSKSELHATSLRCMPQRCWLLGSVENALTNAHARTAQKCDRIETFRKVFP
jgi:hypothetical protein